MLEGHGSAAFVAQRAIAYFGFDFPGGHGAAAPGRQLGPGVR